MGNRLWPVGKSRAGYPTFMNVPSPRALFGALFAVCMALLAFALYLQHAAGLEPCPLCILQRYAFIGVAAVALLAAVHGPRQWGARIYAALTGTLALAGGSVAVRQSLLQRFPPKESQSCLPADLNYLLETFPLSQALPKIFAGSGDCAKVDWRLMGLSVAEWSLVCFLGVLAVSVWVLVARRR